MRRYETRSTMMTSNRPLEDWGKLLGDVPSATAILDRFLHHAEIMHITGKATACGNSPADRTSRPVITQPSRKRRTPHQSMKMSQNQPMRPPAPRRTRAGQNQPMRPPARSDARTAGSSANRRCCTRICE